MPGQILCACSNGLTPMVTLLAGDYRKLRLRRLGNFRDNFPATGRACGTAETQSISRVGWIDNAPVPSTLHLWTISADL